MPPDKAVRDIVIVYDRRHTLHPFIVNAIRTLTEAGYRVSIIDADGPPSRANYTGTDAFNFRQRDDVWDNRRVAAETPLRARISRQIAVADEIATRLAKSPLGGTRLRLSAAWAVARARTEAWKRLRQAVTLWFIFRRSVLDEGRRLLRGMAAVQRARGDAMIGSRPGSALMAWIAARRQGARFVYFPFELYGEQAARHSRLVALGERLMLRCGVDALITQNEARAAVYVRERGFRGRPTIVHNYKSEQPVVPANRLRTALGIPADRRIVLYEGLLVHGRWLDRLIAAADHLPDDTTLVFVGEQKRWWSENAPKLIAACRRPSQIVVGDFIPHDDLLGYVADADVGVIIYDDAVRNNRLCEPGKLSDYVLAGVPIAAPAFPTIAPVIQTHRIGAVFDTGEPEAIAAAIRAVLDPGRDYWRPALQRARKELIWETQAPRLIAAVSGVPVPDFPPKPFPADAKVEP